MVGLSSSLWNASWIVLYSYFLSGQEMWICLRWLAIVAKSWSISSCVRPTIKNEALILANTFLQTWSVRRANKVLFLFSPQLSTGDKRQVQSWELSFSIKHIQSPTQDITNQICATSNSVITYIHKSPNSTLTPITRWVSWNSPLMFRPITEQFVFVLVCAIYNGGK